jgi:hypothetical protein
MKSFKQFIEYISESLTFLTLDKTMKNEFMNRIELKQDFEDAKRIFYNKANCLLTHIESDRFELRSTTSIPSQELDTFIETEINSQLKSMKFRRVNKPKIDILKDKIWLVKADII